jgi:hypothetical protein
VMAEAAAAAVIFIKARYHHAGMCHRMLSPLTVRTRRWQPCTLHLDSNSLPVCAAHAAGDSADLTTMRVGRDQLGQGKWQRVPNRIGFGHAQAELAAQAAALNAVVDAQVGHEPNLWARTVQSEQLHQKRQMDIINTLTTAFSRKTSLMPHIMTPTIFPYKKAQHGTSDMKDTFATNTKANNVNQYVVIFHLQKQCLRRLKYKRSGIAQP